MIEEKITLAFILFVLVAMFACSDAPPPHKTDYTKPASTKKLGDPETVGAGTIRRINFEKRQFIYESDYGFVKSFSSICGKEMMPVWEGMHVNMINFHWHVVQDDMDGGCFQLDYVEHDPKGDQQQSLKPVDASGVTTK